MENGKRMLILASFMMEIVECGGALYKNALAGGISHAAVLLCRPENRQTTEAAASVLKTSVEFLGFDQGHVMLDVPTKKKLVEVIRRFRPDVCIMQDTEHSFTDLDPDRRLAMLLYLESLALASRDFALDEMPELEPCPTPTIYYMTPQNPNCVLNVADIWSIKEEAMNCLSGQQAFTAKAMRSRLSPEVLQALAGKDHAGLSDLELGRRLHDVFDRSFHIYHGHHSHARLAMAEPYRREGPFELEQLPL